MRVRLTFSTCCSSPTALLLLVSACTVRGDAMRETPIRVSRLEVLSWLQDGTRLIVRRVDQLKLGDSGTVSCDSTGLFVIRADSIEAPAEPRNTGPRACRELWDPHDVVFLRDSQSVLVTGTRFALARLNLNTLDLTSIPVPCAHYATSVALHPTSQRMAFIAACDDGHGGTLALADLDGTSYRLVGAALDGTNERYPSWSPDGRRIALIRSRGRDADSVMVVDTVSAMRTVVASGEAVAWSPSGEWLAYGDRQSLGVVRPDGRDARKLVDLAAGDPRRNDARLGPIVWSSDSRRIAFSQRGSVWVVNVTGSGLRKLWGHSSGATAR